MAIDHGKYARLVHAAAGCVVGWKNADYDAPVFVLQLALGLRDAGVPKDLLDEQLGADWEERARTR